MKNEKKNLEDCLKEITDYANDAWVDHERSIAEWVYYQRIGRTGIATIFEKSGPLVKIPLEEYGKTYKVFLPPIEEHPEFLPVLSVQWVFDSSHVECINNSFRLELVNLDDYIIFSLRYDMGSKGTDHSFPHVQINPELKRLGKNGIKNPSWLPPERPCIPLYLASDYQENSIALLSLLWFSLYGLKGIDKMDSLLTVRFHKWTKWFYPERTIPDL